MQVGDIKGRRLLHSVLDGPISGGGMAFAPGAPRLISFRDRGITVIDAIKGKPAFEFGNDRHWHIMPTARSADGCRLAATSNKGTIAVWDLVTGKELLERPYKSATPLLSDDGRRLVIVATDGIQSWDVASGEATPIPVKGESRGFLSRDGELLARTGPDRTIQVWDLVKGELRTTFRGHPGSCDHAVFSPDKSRLFTSSSTDDVVRVWHVATGQEIPFALRHSKNITDLRLSSDGANLAAYSSAGVKLWDGTPNAQ
jgi:WD40 repeat protein